MVRPAMAQSNSAYGRSQTNALTRRNSAGQYTAQQFRTSIYNSSVPRSSASQSGGIFSSALTGRPLGGKGSKPFAGSGSSSSSVSPWLALSDPFASTAHSYYTQVRPQLEMQRANQQLASRNAQMQHQLNQMAAQPPYDPSGSDNMAPTGHAATYMNYGGYYQPTQPTKRPH
jgi:hypothetical protein